MRRKGWVSRVSRLGVWVAIYGNDTSCFLDATLWLASSLTLNLLRAKTIAAAGHNTVIGLTSGGHNRRRGRDIVT
jgi:hypothetical protein